MSTPSRNCSSPKRTINGTTCTASASASATAMSEVLSVTRWITSLEREHVRVVLLSSRLQLEFRARVILAKGGHERVGVIGADLVPAIHRDQFRFRLLCVEHRIDD